MDTMPRRGNCHGMSGAAVVSGEAGPSRRTLPTRRGPITFAHLAGTRQPALADASAAPASAVPASACALPSQRQRLPQPARATAPAPAPAPASASACARPSRRQRLRTLQPARAPAPVRAGASACARPSQRQRPCVRGGEAVPAHSASPAGPHRLRSFGHTHLGTRQHCARALASALCSGISLSTFFFFFDETSYEIGYCTGGAFTFLSPLAAARIYPHQAPRRLLHQGCNGPSSRPSS